MPGVGDEARVAADPVDPHELDDLLGLRASKGRYYREYRHSTHDLERAMLAVNAVSWVLADASGDPDDLVDSTLPVIAEILGAVAVVLVPGPGSAAPRASRSSGAGGVAPDDDLVGALVDAVGGQARDSAVRAVPELGCCLLLAPVPPALHPWTMVVAAVPPQGEADAAELALLGTLVNQLAGAVESSRRLAESERLRQAADAALQESAAQAAALARRNALLKQARHELVTAREQQVLAEERQRIARDLHDSVAQHVLSIGMQVEWCRTSSEQRAVADRLLDVRELARSTVDHIRQAIFELSSDELLPHGLGPGLSRLAEQHRGRDLHIALQLPEGTCALPGHVERTLYLVVKEALFNVVIHAEASRACIALAQSPGSVRLVVSDDGQGRATHLLACLERARQARADGYHRGLPNIEERVRLVGGRLQVQDGPAGGVCLQVDVPVDVPVDVSVDMGVDVPVGPAPRSVA